MDAACRAGGGNAATVGRMTAGTFDTLAAARDLEGAGMDRSQAEAVAAAIRAGQGKLATAADLAAAQAPTRAILTWRMILIAAAQAGLVVALPKLLP